MHFKLTLAVACLACLAVLSDARRWGRGRPQSVSPWREDSSSSDEQSRFRGFDGRRDNSNEEDGSEKGRRGPSGKGPSGRDSGRKQCGMARHSCLVKDADGNQLKNNACPVNTTCTRGPVQIQKDGQTYNFTFCSGRPAPREHMCVPACRHRGPEGRGPDSDPTPEEEMPEMPETPFPEGGAEGPTPGRPEPLIEDVLPLAAQSEAEDIFCQQPAWYMLACSLSDTATGATIKQVSCDRDGNCTRGPGEYVYDGTAVQAYFCKGCEEIEDRPQGNRPRGRRTPHGGRPDRRLGEEREDRPQGARPGGRGPQHGGRPDRRLGEVREDCPQGTRPGGRRPPHGGRPDRRLGEEREDRPQGARPGGRGPQHGGRPDRRLGEERRDRPQGTRLGGRRPLNGGRPDRPLGEEREDRPQGARPGGRRPHHGGRQDRRPGQGERPEGDGQEPGQERRPERPDRSRFGGRSRMFGGRAGRFGRRG